MKRTEQQNLMQALQGAAPTIQKVGWASTFHFICDFVSVFSFSGFKAKAFSFCLFFYPDVMPRTLGISNGQPMLTYVSMTPQSSFS